MSGRLAPISEHSMSSEARKEWQLLTAWRAPGRDGLVGGPYDAWLRSPELLHRMQGLGRFFWERTDLDRGLVEYVIALTSRHWRCNLEWLYHSREALNYGVSQTDLAALLQGAPPVRTDLKLAHDLASALLDRKSIGNPLFDAAVAALGERGVVELTALCGYYTLVALTLRTFEVDAPDGVARPFERPAEA